jgi:penicillin-binding protein 2
VIPAAVFTLICAVFVVALAVIQIKGSKNPDDQRDITVRTVTVPGLRGEIYDRNGKLLVGNATTYDLIFEYGAMPDTRREINASLLSILDGLNKTGNGDKLSDDLFVLDGYYPDYQYVSAMSDKDSDEYYHFLRVMKANEMDAKKTTAKDLVDYYVSRYKLSEDLYSSSEISALIRIYYEMERVGFGAYQSYTLAKDVSMSAVTYVEEARIEGATFSLGTERVYAYPGIASHILGRVGKITAENVEYYSDLGYPMDAMVGTEGCEKLFEEYLRGSDGIMVIEYDKDGNIINKYYKTEPVGGHDVYLTIDIDVQIAAEQALAESVKSISGATGGAVSVLDPKSNAVLALASYPTYDLTRFDDKEYVNTLINNGHSPFLNRALNGVYAPGSTYKLGVALAALEEGVIDANTTFVCNGVYHAHGNPTCTHVDGVTDVTKAIRNSCNIFFYNVLDTAFPNIDSVTKYTTRLGLGVPTGIELDESIGTIAGPSYKAQNAIWYKRDDLSASIGQSDHGYTPLQLSVYTSSLINGGTRYSAHLLDSVHKFYTGETVYSKDATVLDSITIDPDIYNIIVNAMGEVVSENPEVLDSFKNLKVQVGGKTGTSQVTGKNDYAVFTGVAPLDSPEIVASCVIEQGKYGYNAAVPVGKIFEAYFKK